MFCNTIVISCFRYSLLLLLMAVTVWLSGNVVISISEVALCLVWLVVGWVCSLVNHLGNVTSHNVQVANPQVTAP